MLGPQEGAGLNDRPQSLPAIAVSLCDPRKLECVHGGGSLWSLLASLGWRQRPYPSIPDELPADRLYFGNEFCDRLLPSTRALLRAVETTKRAGLALTLLTPLVSDRRIGQLRRLLAAVPEGAEVVVNDLGVLRLVSREFTQLEPVAGRQLTKTIKDPRLSSQDWAQSDAFPVGGAAFARRLRGLGVRRVEMDVAPAVEAASRNLDGMRLSLHGPHGYVAKGPICRIGSLRLSGAAKFGPGHDCRKECLTYGCELALPARPAGGPGTFQRGNTVFYRHGPELTETMWDMFGKARADRLVIAGDWNENRRAH